MKPIIFSLFNNLTLFEAIKKSCNFDMGEIILRPFPDKETSVKINSEVKDRKVIFFASLDRPNNKLLPLLFAAKTAKDLKADEIGLIAPYLPYMRQDKQFNPGEGITSVYFASLLSQHFDWLMTVDPHLHRFHSLNEIYTIPTFVLQATNPISHWIKLNVINPIIIGPDIESEQWVADIAQKIAAPFIILEKIRKGDRDVEISIPQIEQYKNYTPILIDDVISTATTMITTVNQLKKTKIASPICIGVHALFVENAYENLLQTGPSQVITCNSIKHISNVIDLSEVITNALKKLK